MKARLTLTLALLLLCTGAGAALAQGTPDWTTPSEETICDSESGAAFGLCNAYCEAMDCDSPNAQASATACSKVKAKFTNVTGRSFLPCDTCPLPPPGTTCPCNELAGWDSILNAAGGTCINLGTTAIKGNDSLGAIFATCSLNEVTGGGCFANTEAGVGSLDITPEQGSACFYQILDSCSPE